MQVLAAIRSCGLVDLGSGRPHAGTEGGLCTPLWRRRPWRRATHVLDDASSSVGGWARLHQPQRPCSCSCQTTYAGATSFQGGRRSFSQALFMCLRAWWRWRPTAARAAAANSRCRSQRELRPDYGSCCHTGLVRRAQTAVSTSLLAVSWLLVAGPGRARPLAVSRAATVAAST